MSADDSKLKIEKETLVDRLNNLENYLADNTLSEELKVLYAQIQLNCSDFRENVFFKNVSLLEQGSGKKTLNYSTEKRLSDEEHNKRLLDIKTTEELLQEYSH
mmetsp:Transcript_18312/g.18934  ORF Transcript_18312/g.18934 Transcript_18312/m.18934 type:complete len:103 (-) Transcript_18312:79-387(-)